MKNLLRVEFDRILHSKATYIFLFCLLIFYAFNVVGTHQSLFVSVRENWESLDQLDRSMYKSAMGVDDDELAIADIQESGFYTPLTPEIWIILCAAFGIFLFGSKSSRRYVNAELHTGHSRGEVVLSRFLVYYITILIFGVLASLLIQFMFNSGWTELPAGYIARCYAVFALMALQQGAVFLLVMLGVTSPAAASAISVAVCGLFIVIINMRNPNIISIFSVIFPFTTDNQTNLWASELSPELAGRAIRAVVVMAVCWGVTVLSFLKRDVK